MCSWAASPAAAGVTNDAYAMSIAPTGRPLLKNRRTIVPEGDLGALRSSGWRNVQTLTGSCVSDGSGARFGNSARLRRRDIEPQHVLVQRCLPFDPHPRAGVARRPGRLL